MMNPLVGTRMFAVNPEADKLQSEGLKAQQKNNFTDSIDLYNGALLILADETDSVEIEVQRARILRDKGFTYGRKGIEENDIDDLGNARSSIGQSLDKTSMLISRTVTPILDCEEHLDLDHGQYRELLAEHGATLSILGRIATIAQVDFDEIDPEEHSIKIYRQAHKYLSKGSNGYYRVSNAMVAARQERIDGNRFEAAKWLVGKAAVGFAWTLTHDKRNIKRAFGTICKRTTNLRSRRVAEESVYNKP